MSLLVENVGFFAFHFHSNIFYKMMIRFLLRSGKHNRLDLNTKYSCEEMRCRWRGRRNTGEG